MAFTDSNTASCTIAAYRAWANGFWPFMTAVFTAITFQSNTTSAFATADPNRVAINMHSPRTRFFVSPCTIFIALPPDSSWLSVSGDRHIRGNEGGCPYRRACRGVMLCVALKTRVGCTCVSLYRCGVESLSFHGVCHGFRASWSGATDPVWRGLRG